jgi:hypothetical protein
MPIRAISCVRAEQQPVPPMPGAKAAAEIESKLKPLPAASVTPVRAISVTPVRAISYVSAEQQPVLPRQRAKQ